MKILVNSQNQSRYICIDNLTFDPEFLCSTFRKISSANACVSFENDTPMSLRLLSISDGDEDFLAAKMRRIKQSAMTI